MKIGILSENIISIELNYDFMKKSKSVAVKKVNEEESNPISIYGNQ